jgi:hypothetical protein
MWKPGKDHRFQLRLLKKSFPVDKLHNWFDRFDPAKNPPHTVYILLRLSLPGKFRQDKTRSLQHL